MYNRSDHKGILRISHDDISMKTKLISTPFVMLRFIEKSFFITLSGFKPFWDYKPTKTVHVDNPGVYTSEKNLNLSTINNIHLKCDVIDGSVVKDLRQLLPFKFVLDKQSGYKSFFEPEHLITKTKQFSFEDYNILF